jgi:hypothetical protein
VYPAFEKIDDRTYVSAAGLGAPAVTLLLAYEAYPLSIGKKDLEEAVVRHGISKNAASLAINRNLSLFDERDGRLILRALGRQKAEEILHRLQSEN